MRSPPGTSLVHSAMFRYCTCSHGSTQEDTLPLRHAKLVCILVCTMGLRCSALNTAWPCVRASAGIVADGHSLGLVCPESREDTLTETQATRRKRIERSFVQSFCCTARCISNQTSTSPVSSDACQTAFAGIRQDRAWPRRNAGGLTSKYLRVPPRYDEARTREGLTRPQISRSSGRSASKQTSARQDRHSASHASHLAFGTT